MKNPLIILVCAFFIFTACENDANSKKIGSSETTTDQESSSKDDNETSDDGGSSGSETGDENNGGGDTGNGDAPSTCGNSKLDSGEVCDPTDSASASRDCAEINSSYKSGTLADCLETCKGFDENVCEKKDSTPAVGCDTLKEGMNENFDVNGRKRSFILNLPNDVESKDSWPVIFNWHGVGDSASNMSGLLSGSVNNQTMPFILVTPENDDEFGMQTMKGIDWDILNLKDGSVEAELFDAVLACIEERWGADENHIHTTGFSAGSINSNALGVLRGEVLASIFANSGAYFSNPDNVEAMGSMAANFLQWPEMTHGNNYVQVLMHGAEDKDQYGAGPININFYEMATNDADYLNDLGHDVIICNHGQGHTVSNISHIIQFFKDHPKGTVDSPHTALEGYPDFCEFRAKSAK